MGMNKNNAEEKRFSPLDGLIRFSLNNRALVFIFVVVMLAWGILTAPFDWEIPGILRQPVPVDAIPDIGENQQIVFTEWKGRSPQDVEDQVTYPLTTALLGIPGVRDIRSYSMFGFSSIYIIFEEHIGFYWSRSRILEKLNSLSGNTLPEGVKPVLGPDATALGQVFWYTLEGRDEEGNPTGGWDLQELRSLQDWYVKFALSSVKGISEVASIGGFVKEYHIDVDPDAMRAYNVGLDDVFHAVRMSNTDVGARTIEINKAEYVIRGIGFVKNVRDLEFSVIKVKEDVPVYVKDVAHVSLGPATRRGALDKEGAEAVGGVVVVRYGENPLAVIKNVKRKIEEIEPALPRRVMEDGTISQVKIVPFYDRTGLIMETLNTLSSALTEQILITVIVVGLMLLHLRSSILISGLLPLSILMCFIAMKMFGVDANIVALSGIAIAIGTMVDMGIIVCENIVRHLNRAAPDEDRQEVVFRATREVSGAVMTSISTTIISFLPIFTMEAAEGKLFKPLAFTKTFALFSSLIVAVFVIPPAAQMLFTSRIRLPQLRRILNFFLIGAGIAAGIALKWWVGLIIALLGVYNGATSRLDQRIKRYVDRGILWLVIAGVLGLLAGHWHPLGLEKSLVVNMIFTAGLIGGLLLFFSLFKKFYGDILGWCLRHKALFLSIPGVIVFLGIMVWTGFDSIFFWLPRSVRTFSPVVYVAHKFPGLGKEFMPPLDEGAFLYMPTTMPHASIGEALDVVQKQDVAVSAIPEVESAVGKIGRVDSPLDPAPVSMIETIINYKSEFMTDRKGRTATFRFNEDEIDFFRDVEGTPLQAPDGYPYYVQGKFLRDDAGQLIPEKGGYPFRLWRPELDPALNEERERWEGIQSPEDIWNAIVEAAQIPGTTSAPVLQPISARLVMLQSGMRAPMGLKIRGPDLVSIEKAGLAIEKFLKQVPAVKPETVFADRIIGKPYLEIRIDREKIARYGIMLKNVQDVIETAIGGKPVTMTVEGRERYAVRIRYLRELRDTPEALEKILIPAPGDRQIPLNQLAQIEYVRGPQVIKSEDTFLTGYVLFDKKTAYAETDTVEQADDYLRLKMKNGELKLPAGVSFSFAGSYQNQVRASKKLAVVLPLALMIIFVILYLQFKRVSTSLLVFSGIITAWAGGFIFIWLYGQSWFMNFSLLGTNLRDLFQIHTLNLSVAVWVGFLALFGIASDDGVVMTSYLENAFSKKKTNSIEDIRKTTVKAGKRRVRACLMTTATTILALMPILTSTGRGADIMIPMAIPSFGGMMIEVITMLIVPVIYCAIKELKFRQTPA